MSEDPSELQGFFDETVAPLVAYDEQYETELVRTLETFLDADGNVAAHRRAAVHPPPHDPLPARAREGADRASTSSSTDGRERLSPRPEGDASARHRRRPAAPPPSRAPRPAACRCEQKDR